MKNLNYLVIVFAILSLYSCQESEQKTGSDKAEYLCGFGRFSRFGRAFGDHSIGRIVSHQNRRIRSRRRGVPSFPFGSDFRL